MTAVHQLEDRAEPAEVHGTAPHHAPRKRKRGGALVRLFLLLTIAATAAGYVYSRGVEQSRSDARRAITTAKTYLAMASRKITTGTTAMPQESASASREAPARPAWKGLVEITDDDAKSIGLQVVTVRAQSEPIRLELTGRTDYDPNSLTKIRPRFDTLVQKVYPEIGQLVKKGDPLVDLYSIELAAAKNDFQTAFVQWRHDQRLLDLRRKLVVKDAIAQQVLVDTINDEAKSRLNYDTARGKLRLLGVPEEEIDPLLRNLGDEPLKQDPGEIDKKAQMTRLCPVDGVVIKKDVARGNLYDSNDILMEIAALDHLFVWVNVYEKDQSKVFVGQDMEISFPYLNETIQTKVQYMSTAVSKETRAIRIRTSIPNSNGKVVADNNVRATLMIPALTGQTVVPRLAMVVMVGGEFAFVRRPGHSQGGIEAFERRRIQVAQERADQVVVSRGLEPGEEVAANGSLILSQIFEDQQIVETGVPVK